MIVTHYYLLFDVLLRVYTKIINSPSFSNYQSGFI